MTQKFSTEKIKDEWLPKHWQQNDFSLIYKHSIKNA